MNYKLCFLAICTIALASCQSTNSTRSGFEETSGRSIANNQIFTRFIAHVSAQSGNSVDDIERQILQYIKTKQSNGKSGNWSALGLTENQAKRIQTLSDDMPYMRKVRKWATENITTAINIRKNIARKAYREVIKNHRGLINPYRLESAITGQARRMRRNQTSPLLTPRDRKHKRVLESINSLEDKSLVQRLKKSLAAMQKRGEKYPEVHINGLESIESAALISKKTGHKGLGSGCESFNKTASFEVLESKANVDIYRARLISEHADAKAGRSIASFDEVPVPQRLTADEIDDITARSFRDVLGYTDDEARVALARLKKKPCKLY